MSDNITVSSSTSNTINYVVTNNNGRYNEFLSKYKFSENFSGSRTCIPFNIKSSRFMYL